MKQTYQQCNIHVHIPMNIVCIYIYIWIQNTSIKKIHFRRGQKIPEGGRKSQKGNQLSQKSEDKPNRAQKCGPRGGPAE